MIRVLRALAWMRWRTLVNTLRSRGGRDTGERISRILHVAVPVLIPLLMLPTAVGLGLLSLWGGRILAGQTTAPPPRPR